MLRKFVPYFFIITLSTFLSINFFWLKQYLPGFDTPFYLSAIRNFSQNIPSIVSYSIPDRYLVIGFPALLSRIFHLDPIMSYRIAITLVSVLIACLLTKLMQNLTKSRLSAMVMASALIISPYLLNYSYMLFANYSSFVILFAFFAVETGKEFRFKSIILGVILGLVFYVHNFSSVAYCLVVGMYFVYKLILDEKKLSTVKRFFIVFLITCVVGSFGIIRYFPVTLPPFLTMAASESFVSPITSAIKTILPSQPAILGNEAVRIKSTFIDEIGKYWLVYFVLFSIYILITKRKEVWKNKKYFVLPLALFTTGFLFSFQPLIGLNFLPERFIGLVTLSTFFFYAIFLSFFSKSKLFKIVAVLPLLCTYLSSDTRILDKGPVFINDTEVSFYQNIKQITSKNKSSVLIPDGQYYWASYYLDGYNLIPGDYFIACGTIKVSGFQTAPVVAYAKLLSETDKVTAQNDLDIINKYLAGDERYLITNHSMNCGEGYILNKLTGIKLIYSQDNFYLYEIL